MKKKNINEGHDKIASEDSHPMQNIKAHFLFNPKPETSKSRAQTEIMLNFENWKKGRKEKNSQIQIIRSLVIFYNIY